MSNIQKIKTKNFRDYSQGRIFWIAYLFKELEQDASLYS